MADNGSIKEITKAINGGDTAGKERELATISASQVLTRHVLRQGVPR